MWAELSVRSQLSVCLAHHASLFSYTVTLWNLQDWWGPILGMQEIEVELGRDEVGTKCHLPPPVPNFIRQCVPPLLASEIDICQSIHPCRHGYWSHFLTFEWCAFARRSCLVLSQEYTAKILFLCFVYEVLHENFLSVIIIRRYMFLLGYSLVIYQFHQIFVGSIFAWKFWVVIYSSNGFNRFSFFLDISSL